MANIKINLMLKEYAPPRKAGLLEWGLVAGMLLSSAAGAVYYMGVAADADQMAEQAASQEQRLHRVKAQLAEAALIRQREVRVDQAEGELKGLVGRRWSNVLLTLRDLTPQDVTWQLLSVDGDAMTLKATSQGLVDVAQLFSGLIVHQQVAEVSLRYVNEKGIKIEFSLEPATGEPVPQEQIRPASEFRQLEFEVVITLVRQEGGVPDGA